MSVFDDVYRRSLEQREEFWAEAAGAIDWIEPWTRVLDDSRAPFYRWFSGGTLNTCFNALDRHVERGRADQLALIYDSPVTRHDDDVHLPGAPRPRRAGGRGASRRGGGARRPGDRLHADGPGSGRGDARVCAHRGGALRGLRRLRRERAREPDRGCAAEGRRHRVVRDRSGADRRLQAASRRGDRHGRGEAGAMHRRAAPRAGMRPRSGTRPVVGGGARGRRARARACPSRPPTRSTSSTRRGRPVSRRGSSATTGGTPSRSSGR